MGRYILNFLIFATVCSPTVAFAHAFAEPFIVPVPLSLYLIGSSAALIASFVLFYLFTSAGSLEHGTPFFEIRPRWWRGVAVIIKFAGIAAALLVIVAGFFGGGDYTSNPAPGLFWAGLILGMAYLSALVDGIWALANPFETAARFVFGQRPGFFRYPERLGCFPTLVLYYMLIGLELFSDGAGGVPIAIASILTGYLVLTLVGGALFGVSTWSQYGDFFNVFFGTLGLFAPVQIRASGISFYRPFARLIAENPGNVFRLLFVLFILASTAFDGFTGTQFWSNTVYSTYVTTILASLFGYVLFAIALPLFFGFYALVILLLKKITQTEMSFTSLLLRFSYSLVPIALAYNIAHYFTWIVSEGLSLLSLISDPLNRGWNIFGTAGRWTAGSPFPLSADTVWNIQVVVIVLAHIIATYVAHKIALDEFKDRRTALVSQLPMLILMIGYTVFGLWILSQPLGTLS